MKDAYGVELKRGDMVCFPRVFRNKVHVLRGIVSHFDRECLTIAYQPPVKRVFMEKTWYNAWRQEVRSVPGRLQYTNVEPGTVTKLSEEIMDE